MSCRWKQDFNHRAVHAILTKIHFIAHNLNNSFEGSELKSHFVAIRFDHSKLFMKLSADSGVFFDLFTALKKILENTRHRTLSKL